MRLFPRAFSVAGGFAIVLLIALPSAGSVAASSQRLGPPYYHGINIPSNSSGIGPYAWANQTFSYGGFDNFSDTTGLGNLTNYITWDAAPPPPNTSFGGGTVSVLTWIGVSVPVTIHANKTAGVTFHWTIRSFNLTAFKDINASSAPRPGGNLSSTIWASASASSSTCTPRCVVYDTGTVVRSVRLGYLAPYSFSLSKNGTGLGVAMKLANVSLTKGVWWLQTILNLDAWVHFGRSNHARYFAPGTVIGTTSSVKASLDWIRIG